MTWHKHSNVLKNDTRVAIQLTLFGKDFRYKHGTTADESVEHYYRARGWSKARRRKGGASTQNIVSHEYIHQVKNALMKHLNYMSCKESLPLLLPMSPFKWSPCSIGALTLKWALVADARLARVTGKLPITSFLSLSILGYKLLTFRYSGIRALCAHGLDGIVGWWPVRENKLLTFVVIVRKKIFFFKKIWKKSNKQKFRNFK